MVQLLDKIQARLWTEKLPVTARWVCYEYICQMAIAQELLRECKAANEGKVATTWLIEGGYHAQAAFFDVLEQLCYSLCGSAGSGPYHTKNNQHNKVHEF